MKYEPPIIKENVRKVVIVAFTDKNYQAKAENIDPFPLPVNPDTYSQNYKIEYDLRQGHGQQGTNAQFKSTTPEELKLEFTFDGTGTIEGYRNKDGLNVHDQIELFKNTVYKMNGDIHKPNFLKIFWGDLVFPCILTNLDINYTLFTPDGMPLRAKISTTFVNYVAQEKRVAEEGKKSPDLTHIREVKGDDRLDLMTYRIYNDTQYLLQIAKANRLTSFRKLVVGSKLNFPPLDKTEI